MSRARALTALLLGALVAAPPGASAEDAARITVKAHAGFSDQPREGWLPVGVSLENQADAVSLKIVVTLVRRPGTQGERPTPSFVAEKVIALPARARRHDDVYVPLDRSVVGLTVEVFSGKTAIFTLSQPLQVLSREAAWDSTQSRQVNVLRVARPGTDGRVPFPWLDGVNALGPRGPASTTELVGPSLEPRDLPDRIEGYDGVDLVALAEPSARDFDRARTDALLAWIRRGGHVLLLPGAEPAWFRDELARALLPPDLAVKPLERPVGELLPEVFDGEIRGEGKTLVYAIRSDAVVGHVERMSVCGRRQGVFELFKLGEGDVGLATLDLGARRWAELYLGGEPAVQALVKRFVETLGPPTLTTLQRRTRKVALGEQLLGGLDDLAVPSPLLILPVVVVYLFCIGPLNRRLVQWRRAPLTLVVTTPVIALAFAVLIFEVGYARRGVTTTVERATIVSSIPGESKGLLEAALFLRSATSSTYDVKASPGLTAWQRSPGKDEQSTRRVNQDEGRFGFPSTPLLLWEYTLFEAQGPVDLGDGLSLTLDQRGAVLVNRTNRALGPGFISYLTREGGIPVPSLAPGASVRVPRTQGSISPTAHDVAIALVGSGTQTAFATRVLQGLDLRPGAHETVYVSSFVEPLRSIEVLGFERTSRDLSVLVVRADDYLGKDEEILGDATDIVARRHAHQYEQALSSLVGLASTDRINEEARRVKESLRLELALREAENAYHEGDVASSRALLGALEGESEAVTTTARDRLAVWETVAAAFASGEAACSRCDWKEAARAYTAVVDADQEYRSAYFEKARRRIDILVADRARPQAALERGNQSLASGLYFEAGMCFDVALSREEDPTMRAALLVALETDSDMLALEKRVMDKAWRAQHRGEAREIIRLLLRSPTHELADLAAELGVRR